MRIMLYASNENLKNRLSNAISLHCVDGEIEVYSNVQSLNHRLRQSCWEESLVVLLTSNIRELRRVKTISASTNYLRIILVLPDHHQETIAIGHSMFPRFISYTDSDFEDVGAVIGNIMGKSKSIITPHQ